MIRILWLLLAAMLAPLCPAETLRSGCSPSDEQVASVTISDQLDVRMALAGEGQTCYKIAINRDGNVTLGYVLGESLPAVAAFVHEREALAQSTLEAYARQAKQDRKDVPKKDVPKNAVPLPAGVPAVFEDFSARDLKGRSVSLFGLGGRVILVTFWSPQSRTSREKLNSMTSLYSEFKHQGLRAVGISMDPNAGHILQALDDVIIDWPQVTDRSGLARRYEVDPKAGQTFVLDSSHHVLAAGLSGPDMEAKVVELLGKR